MPTTINVGRLKKAGTAIQRPGRQAVTPRRK